MSAASVVSAPSGHEHDPGERQAGELLPHAVQRGAELGLRAAERELVRRTPAAPARDENRKVRTTNRSDSDFSTPLCRIAELLPRDTRRA